MTCESTKSSADSLAGDLANMMSSLRAIYESGRTRPIEWRLRQLEGIERLLVEREEDFARTLERDLGRTPMESWLGDLAGTVGEAKYARKHLRSWMRPAKQKIPVSQWPASGRVQYEPVGVVLVISPWNYPVFLSLSPVIAALSAGNCAVLKPSELAPTTSALLADLLPKYIDPEAVRVVEGDGHTTQELIALGFDHVFFTGGLEVGKKIMTAAAQTLTPVTLELGGKSPVIVTADADLDVAARRIAWVKLMNSGQTCIAPDYVLVEASVRDELVDKIATTIKAFRSDVPEGGQRIVNSRQFDRLKNYIDSTTGTIVAGGAGSRDMLMLEPTVVVEPGPDDPLMTEEIFGPILPVLAVQSVDEAIRFVNTRPTPLALYVFGGPRATSRRIVNAIPSGGAVIDHVAMHCLVPALPFGGVGASGIGTYHGRWGFEALSHRRAVLAKSTRIDLRMFYPPYTPAAIKIIRRLF